MNRITGILVMFVAIVLTAPAVKGQLVQITNVTLSFETVSYQPVALNDNDLVVGNYVISNGTRLGFVYSGPDVATQTLAVPGSVGFTRAGGINDSNTIVGDYFGSDGVYHGYTYSGGAYTTYNLPGFDETKNKFSTSLFGISHSGNLAGAANPSLTSINEGFVVIGGTLYGFYAGDQESTYAYGINDSGVAVGQYLDSSNVSHGFIWSAAAGLTGLDYPGAASTSCQGINNSGLITGAYVDAYGFLRGFSYLNGTFTTTDLVAYGDNNDGSYVGSYTAPGGAKVGFKASPVSLPNPTSITVAGARSTSVYGINIYRDVVGAYTDSSGVNHGLLLTAGGKLTDLDDPNAAGNSTVCQGISSNGDIVCNYTDGNGYAEAAIYSGGTFTEISIPGAADITANDIAGDTAVGGFIDFLNNTHGFLLQGGANGALTELNVPGATFTVASGTDAAGLVTVYWGDSAGFIESSVYNHFYNTYTKANLPGATYCYITGIDAENDLTYVWADLEGNLHGGLHLSAGKGYDYLVDFPGGTGTRTYGIVSEVSGPVLVGRYQPSASSANFDGYKWVITLPR